MSSEKTSRGSAGSLRYAGYFAWFIGTVVAFHAVSIVREEYIAQHQWPIAPGEVISAEEKSGRNPGTSSSSTQYFMRFTVEFDPPLDQCGPGMYLTTVEGPTRCMGTLDTLEGSSDSAYQWMRRHPVQSQIRVHYQPGGSGLRFAGESIADIYPWKEIFVTAVIFLVGFGIALLGRRREELAQDSPPGESRDSPDGFERRRAGRSEPALTHASTVTRSAALV
jgi:hypothetical protein